MGKGLQIALMALLYAASAAGGYFVYDLVAPSEDRSHEVEVQVSHVPEIRSAVPERQNNGKYSLTIDAAVESGEVLEYQVYSDTLKGYYSHGLENSFNDIPSISSETYYVRVRNVVTSDLSKFVEVKGFKGQAAQQKFRKITADEIERIVRDYDTAPKGLNQSIAPGFTITLVGVPADPRVNSLLEVANRISRRQWVSVKVADDIVYDSQDRIKSLTLQVTPK